MGLLSKIKLEAKASSIRPAEPAVPIGSKPTKKSIYESRLNVGTNFGSLFVLESFMFGDYFIDGASTELEAVRNQVKKNGVDKTRELLESHWSGYASNEDWDWLKNAGVNSIRIPLGYWHVDGGKFVSGTNFEGVKGVYSNAWKYYTDLIKKAGEYQIGILVDLHALPYGANAQDHSGEKLSKAGFWSSSHIAKGLEVVEFLAKELARFENISGLQIVNETEFDNEAKYQKLYYSNAINAIREHNGTVPIVISDGWWPDQWVKWISSNSSKGNLGVVIDAHVYRCFSDDDKSKSADRIIDDLEGSVLTNLSAKADIMVGEFSCVLDGQTWDKTSGDRNELVKRYGKRQIELFRQRTCGYYFWSYKFQHGDGGEWGFRAMCPNAIPQYRLKGIPSENDMQNELNSKLNDHANYWNSQNSNEKYEHWRYEDGFRKAYQDSVEFANFNASQIGRKVAWTDARKADHIKAKGNSNFVWEWEQGFESGLAWFVSVAFD
ncbi:unnamed protein product [Kuraishia capsulata CBS 1993]|uniref:Uncharacterized protein n=1 Tax=Kuraishia capsulata CBS 1993 TaxID=1382522 RepID=W6MPB8_9ASCO|nr:uncharacterized protein KUCA_T00004487001 [Kuraishia capsulata CBS 1993]CDK28504.1 unnamed protein product [Kuraishia capsulata CBS 1993]